MKTVKWIKTGEMIQSSAKYLISKKMITRFEEAAHAMLDDSPVREWFHLYEYDPATDHSFQRELNFAKGLKVETA